MTSVLIMAMSSRPGHPRLAGVLGLAGLASLVGLLVAGCATAPPPGSGVGVGERRLRVVAAENFWGSVAAQVGGDRVEVHSIIDSPDADPHDYEPTAADARAVATADVVVVNGIGYDTWATRLVEADESPDLAVVDVGDVVGVGNEANPHRWYDPAAVDKVAAAITVAYRRADPGHAATYDEGQRTFLGPGTADYRAVIAEIRRRWSGTPVGASESIVAMLTPALGLDLVTPPGFLRAVSEGTDPTAADKATADQQVRDHAVAVYVYNSQNATPDVQAQVDAARSASIPVVTMTETMVPAGATWQAWQTAQLEALRDALAKARP
jgi:zinc/manganese transport system substrate-binding protein